MAAFLLSPSSLSLPNPLSSLSSLSLSPFPIHRRLRLSPSFPPPPLTIRNGGGPRTFPGGVSKWQWKRMQAKKAKQLLKARLLRERQIYDMRKRSELKAAVAQLERPWEEVAERAPTLFSVSADDQVRALADRFQRPGGFDMWSDCDGPRVFRRIASGELPTARFFPKGVVHSTRPYGGGGGGGGTDVFDDWIARGAGGGGSRRQRRTRRLRSGSEEEEGEEGFRPNAYGKGNGRSGSTRNGGITLRPTTDIVDVEVVDRNRKEGVRRNSSERADGKAAGRERYGMINPWRRGNKNDSDNVTMRPTVDSYGGPGGIRGEIGDSKWNSGASGLSRNNRRSK
ncbi:uncharacterized protein M6B38_306270 [Iris pallida]|uniref:DEAD-box ATP-dependent RNA helicase 33 n=1 Tax=Iris pallida TaxID=29817 RepID=A0AAX6HLA3_IRIPA|nr:uncharacterized protein M6B38_306270 [Iris pallida]